MVTKKEAFVRDVYRATSKISCWKSLTSRHVMLSLSRTAVAPFSGKRSPPPASVAAVAKRPGVASVRSINSCELLLPLVPPLPTPPVPLVFFATGL